MYPVGKTFWKWKRNVDNFSFQIIKWIVTHLRNEARKEGNKTKGLTAKLIGRNLIFSNLTPIQETPVMENALKIQRSIQTLC